MPIFNVHTLESAPEQSREVMGKVETQFGFLPNIYAVLSESPAVIKAYTSLSNLLGNTTFSRPEQQLMLLTISAANGCEYCVAAHTVVGKRAKLDPAVIEAVRYGHSIEDARLKALHRFTLLIVESRGNVSGAEIDTFMAAGFSKEQVLEVVLAASLKTLSNYINHFAETPLDDAFLEEAWEAPLANIA
ncbi:MAG TPA: carboxymuconolactone decarboxylase family protein [Rhodospirillales bacterium]|nr:carboxymuconolactone decarboxylase family protein [Rhodospirillales bacterium]